MLFESPLSVCLLKNRDNMENKQSIDICNDDYATDEFGKANRSLI